MKSAVLLYNPQSGPGKDRFPGRGDLHGLPGLRIRHPPAADRFCGQPFDDGNETLSLMVVAGGDGTLNFALNAMKRKGLDIPSA